MCPDEEMTEGQKPVEKKGTDLLQVSENGQQENCGRNKFHGSGAISWCIGPTEQTGKAVVIFHYNFYCFTAEMEFSPISPS